jgi:hypothetical protein
MESTAHRRCAVYDQADLNPANHQATSRDAATDDRYPEKYVGILP